MKKLVAYSSVSHLGFVMLGMFALNPARAVGLGAADDQPRPLDRRALPARRHRLRAPPHPDDRRLRRPREGDAGLRHDLHDHHDGVDRPADPQRLHRRVHDPGRRVQPLRSCGRSWPPPASCSARPTCCGCTSGCSSARSRTRRTRTLKDVNLARAVDADSADRPVLLDRPLPEAVLRIMEPSIERIVRVVDPDYLNSGPRRRCRPLRRGAPSHRRARRARRTEGAGHARRSPRLPARAGPGRLRDGRAPRRRGAQAAARHSLARSPLRRLALAAALPSSWRRASTRAGRALLLRHVRGRPLRRLLQGAVPVSRRRSRSCSRSTT